MKSACRKNYQIFRHTIFRRILRACLFCLVGAGIVTAARGDFIETYDDGTDVGLWHCSVGAPRTIETSGGNPGAYVQQGGFSSSIPTWASISTRFQPGVPDPYKIDSIYTGDWTSLGVTSITADLNVIQVATWATDRAVTLELLRMDETGFSVNYDATYTLPDLPEPPIGWQTYSLPVDANSPTIPQGWVFTRGDGTPGTDAEWSPFLHRIDLTSIGFTSLDLVIPVSALGYSGSTTLKSTSGRVQAQHLHQQQHQRPRPQSHQLRRRKLRRLHGPARRRLRVQRHSFRVINYRPR